MLVVRVLSQGYLTKNNRVSPDISSGNLVDRYDGIKSGQPKVARSVQTRDGLHQPCY